MGGAHVPNHINSARKALVTTRILAGRQWFGFGVMLKDNMSLDVSFASKRPKVGALLVETVTIRIKIPSCVWTSMCIDNMLLQAIYVSEEQAIAGARLVETEKFWTASMC